VFEATTVTGRRTAVRSAIRRDAAEQECSSVAVTLAASANIVAVGDEIRKEETREWPSIHGAPRAQ